MKFELQSTQAFTSWLSKQKDRTIKNQLLSRLARIENGTMVILKPCPPIYLNCAVSLVEASECITRS
ncbi:hypothetical protein CRENPOLYSF2_1380018 [Crenothrix polyspora]|uniref:Uncharacterized protein n=1 Tax=Crenothrix polyspora TaxID=360316 RepID=A0A1R4H1E1_9GAMM|nr:hypothetical protein CRENPOLYSF2_1380018 [Crenothrix polyspora]